MLRWPSPEALTPIAKKNLERFRASGAVAELEQDAHDWRFEMWSWRDEPTIRLTLQNELEDERVITIDESGAWEVTPGEILHLRGPKAPQPDAKSEDDPRTPRKFAEWLRNALHPERTVVEARSDRSGM